MLLNLGELGGFKFTPWADRVQLIDANYVGTWGLPALGAVTAPTAVLVRTAYCGVARTSSVGADDGRSHGASQQLIRARPPPDWRFANIFCKPSLDEERRRRRN